MSIIFFIIGSPFIVWFSVELGQYPIPKTNCTTTTSGYVLNSTANTCTIQITSTVIKFNETCGDLKGIIQVNTNCNGSEAIPQYSLVGIINDASQWYEHFYYSIMLGFVCLIAFLPAIILIIMESIDLCIKKKNSRESNVPTV